jgi:hypothetical protein
VACEPADTELWVAGGGEVIEVAKDEDGAVGGTDDGNCLGCVGGDELG